MTPKAEVAEAKQIGKLGYIKIKSSAHQKAQQNERPTCRENRFTNHVSDKR